MSYLKTPIRYPGGKSKVSDLLTQYIPSDTIEYREPFIGGASVYLNCRQKYNFKNNWINDLNPDLYCFWEYVRNDVRVLIKHIKYVRDNFSNGRHLFNYYGRKDIEWTKLEIATRYYIKNRISYSGMVDTGGYSEDSFQKRLTNSIIDRLRQVAIFFRDVNLTNLDYEFLLSQSGNKVFIFLDPPYLSATDSRLYGVKGELHKNFDHDRLAFHLRNCNHKWLMTYDDCPEICRLYRSFTITRFDIQYCMYSGSQAKQTQELLIANYDYNSK